MNIKNRIKCVFGILATLMLPACMSSHANRPSKSSVKYLGYSMPNSELFASVGGITLVSPDNIKDHPYANGTGVIIGETDSYYLGITVAHVFNDCLQNVDGKTNEESKLNSNCWMAFPRNEKQDSWDVYKISPYFDSQGKHALIYEQSKNMLIKYDFAMFKVEKNSIDRKQPERTLIPLPIVKDLVPNGQPYVSMTAGYPSGILRPMESNAKSTLVYSNGVLWPYDFAGSDNGSVSQIKFYDDSFVFTTNHSRPGNSGSPILAKLRGANKWAVAGLLFGGASEFISASINVDSLKSAAKDSNSPGGFVWSVKMFYDKFPNLDAWARVGTVSGADILPSKEISLKSAKIKLTNVQGEILTDFNLTFAESSGPFSESGVFMNGVALKYLENHSVKFDGNMQTVNFQAQIFESQLSQVPTLTIESINADQSIGFAACTIPGKSISSLQIDQVYDLKCAGKVTRELF